MAKNQIISPPPPLPAAQHIKLANSNNLNYLHKLQHTWGHNLGYLNKTVLSKLIDSNCAWLIDENRQNAGYLLIYPQKKGILKVVQIAIEPELLRTTLGTELLRTLIDSARTHDSTCIRLASRQDLTANQFWPTLGFDHTGTFRSKSAENPLMFEWSINLISTTPSEFFETSKKPLVKLKPGSKYLQNKEINTQNKGGALASGKGIISTTQGNNVRTIDKILKPSKGIMSTP